MPKVANTPAALRAYNFHGLDLNWEEGREQALGECPFCGKDKFYISVEKGLWDCKVCGEKGNVITFLRKLWTESDKTTPSKALDELASERKLLYPETLMAWGVCKSLISGEWLIPGYNPAAKIIQLYRYSKLRTKEGEWVRRLLPTPGLEHGHGMFLPVRYDPKKPVLNVTEGLWDGMALWETLRCMKRDESGEYGLTANEEVSFLSFSNIIATPGCNVFPDNWLPATEGKKVQLFYDSDHPREYPSNSGRYIQPGLDGTKRLVKILAVQNTPPEECHYLRWGVKGYDEEAPDGFDVRDLLARGAKIAERVKLAEALMGMVVPVPDEWIPGGGKGSGGAGSANNGSMVIRPLPCKDWKQLINYWRKALLWRRSLDDTLSVMLAVAASTMQRGDQLFLQVIGDAGSAKTRLCDAMLKSKNCYPLEHLTGFHSGWKGQEGENRKDYSLISRINGKCCITPEGDVLMSSPYFTQIMSQQRRIFDGTSGASYKNSKEDLHWTGLRTPWIIAGTPALMDTDQSRLGDRFLRIILDQPDEYGRREILRRVGFSAIRDVKRTANCSAASSLSEEMLAAFQHTAGYVDYLRVNIADLLENLEVDEEGVVDLCSQLAEFTADLRARPNSNRSKEEANDTKELPSRLTIQLTRLAYCLAAVMGKRTIDEEVLRRVRKVAVDTAHGLTLTIVKVLYKAGTVGLSQPDLTVLTKHADTKDRNLLHFLRKMGVVDRYRYNPPQRGYRWYWKWHLTDRTRRLYEVALDAM